jgi:hypothetical protein
VTNAKMARDPFLIILLMVRSKPSTSFLFHVYYCLIWTGNTNMILIFSIRPKHYVLSEGYYFCPKKKWGGTIIQLIWIICFQNIKLWDTSKSNIRTRKLLIYYGGEMSHVFYIRLLLKIRWQPTLSLLSWNVELFTCLWLRNWFDRYLFDKNKKKLI